MEGTPFGRYRLIELLGRGGMGEVWRAHDTVTDRVVAIKLLPANFSENAEFQQRFRREAHAAARLNTPHVIPIHDYGEIDGRLFVSMRLIEGRDLQAVLAYGPIHPARAVRIIEQVAKALQASHQVGLLHRDVKPSNILLDADDFAYLIDFGLARAADQTRLTQSGNTIGTFAYIAPERLGARAEEDARADIYSLACVLYECLTGHQPFEADSMPQLIAAHLHTPPPQPSATQPNVPATFDPVIATGMAKHPDQRYQTTTELANAAHKALALAAGAPTKVAKPPTPPSKPPKPATPPRGHRSRWPTTAGAIVVILLLSAIALVVWPRHQDRTTNGTTSTPTSVVPSITFEGMRDFVTAYYKLLPAQPYEAWGKLDADHQNRWTGLQTYLDFWAKIKSVTLISVSLRDATSVVARLRYLGQDGRSDTEDRWLSVVLKNGVVLIHDSERIGSVSEAPTPSPTTNSPPRPPVPVGPLDGLLLGPDQINTAMGATGMRVATTYTTMKDLNGQLSDTACLPLADPADAAVYAGSGWYVHAMRGEGLDEPSWTHRVYQNVVLFSSAHDADAFLTASAQSWPACANRQYTYTEAGKPDQVWTVGPVSNTNGTLSATKTEVLGDGWTCQRALTAAKAVAIDVEACTKSDTPLSGSALNIAQQIAAKVPT